MSIMQYKVIVFQDRVLWSDVQSCYHLLSDTSFTYMPLIYTALRYTTSHYITIYTYTYTSTQPPHPTLPYPTLPYSTVRTARTRDGTRIHWPPGLWVRCLGWIAPSLSIRTLSSEIPMGKIIIMDNLWRIIFKSGLKLQVKYCWFEKHWRVSNNKKR